jgi:hypothetical protein
MVSLLLLDVSAKICGKDMTLLCYIIVENIHIFDKNDLIQVIKLEKNGFQLFLYTQNYKQKLKFRYKNLPVGLKN